MLNGKGVGSGFLLVMLFSVFCVVGYCYSYEERSIENSITVAAEVVNVRSFPRKRIFEVKADDERFLGATHLVAVPFWDTRKKGDRLRVRVYPDSPSLVKVDEFIYLHKVSVSILAAFMILMAIVLGAIIYRKIFND